MTHAYSDVLLVGGRPNQWVKYVNNDGNAAHVYVSTAVTTFQSATTGAGVYTFNPSPIGGIYTSYLIDGSLSATAPAAGDVRWAPSGITSHVVSYTVGDDAALNSTTVSGSPNTKAAGILAGEHVTALNPTDGKAFGVMSDGQFISDAVMNGTTAVLTSASGLFAAGDVGKIILVPGAGAAGALLSTTIASFQSATQVTLAAVSQTAVSGGTGGQTTWGTDDSAAWVAAYAAVLAGARVLIPWGYSLYKGTFMGGITKSLTLEGLGAMEMWGTEVQSSATSIPGVAPFVVGSVLVQCQAASNGIDITGTGTTVHRRNFGIKFADGLAFLNTGHGINASPSAVLGGGHDNGETGSREDSLIVWGHDGNHYAYNALNDNLTTAAHLRSYGGGVLNLSCDSTSSDYGNALYDNVYGSLFCGGTAHGFALSGVAVNFPGQLNLVSFIRPQCNVQAVPSFATGRGIAAVTAAQHLWSSPATLAVAKITVYGADLENDLGGVTCPIDYATSNVTGQYTIIAGGIAESNPVSAFQSSLRIVGTANSLKMDRNTSGSTFNVLRFSAAGGSGNGDILTLNAGTTNGQVLQVVDSTGTGVILKLGSPNSGNGDRFVLNVPPTTQSISAGFATSRISLFDQPTISSSNVVAVTTAATVAIADAPTTAGTGPPSITNPAALWLQSSLATPAGGSAKYGLLFGSGPALGVLFGSGVPTVAALKGSLYLRTDGSSGTTRAYINTDGSTTWTSIATAA